MDYRGGECRGVGRKKIDIGIGSGAVRGEIMLRGDTGSGLREGEKNKFEIKIKEWLS